ncbi:MAG TPA: hypothetical protein VFU21_01200 [Kofleriaceae bacterium]|nr:hypothetical protein [Kofleriaceae bacterium]
MKAWALLLSSVLVACGGGPERDGTSAAQEPSRPAAERSPTAERRTLERARCPAGLADCAEATGRVIAVEAVDPDGDGDAHYVLAGGRVTAPGISVIDVARTLRPRRLPRIGDRVSAAGPVYTGSYGQRQIQAVVIHHDR